MAKKKPAGRTNRTRQTTAADWGPLFLHALAITGNIKAACTAAHVGRTTVYDRRDSDEAFAKLMALALDDATDDLELEARRRAHEGVDKPVFGSGGTGVGTVEVGTIREYSDSLMMFLLKAHRPEKYREHHQVNVSGKVAVSVAQDLSDDDLARIAAAALAKPEQPAPERKPG